MTDIADDTAMVLYDIDPELRDDVEGLKKVFFDHPDTRWYARRRLGALLAATQWNEKLHPRGPDGRFIETGGWVRWLLNGLWRAGKVVTIDPNTGMIKVRPDKDNTFDGKSTVDFSPADAKNKLYKAPSRKARLKLPNPKTNETPGQSWKKVGGQGGSNPGAKYKVLKASPKTGTDVYKSPFGIAAGYFGKIVDKHDGDYVDDLQEADIIRNNSDGEIFRIEGDKLLDVRGIQQGTFADVDPIDVAPVLFPTHEDRDAAWEEMLAYAGAVSSNDEFYIKAQKSADHSMNEALANYLYELAGVNVPEVNLGEDPTLFASKIVNGESVKDVGDVLSDPEIMSQVRKDFAIDAWLANWDTVGLGYENIKVVDGVPYRIDAGGSLLFRAQGAAKGKAFGNSANEIDTLRDPSINPQAGKVFGGATDEEIRDGLERLAGISPEQIHATVDAITDQNGSFEGLGDKLVARRSDLLSRFNITDPWVEDVAEETPLPSGPVGLAPTPSVTTSPVKSVPASDAKLKKINDLVDDNFMDLTPWDTYTWTNDNSLEGKPEALVFGGKVWAIENMMFSGGEVEMLLRDPVDNHHKTAFFLDQALKVSMKPEVITEYSDMYEELATAVIAEELDLNPSLPELVNTNTGYVSYYSLPFDQVIKPKTTFNDPPPNSGDYGSGTNWELEADIQVSQGTVTEERKHSFFVFDTNSDKLYQGKYMNGGTFVVADTEKPGSETFLPGDNDIYAVPENKFTQDWLAAYNAKVQKANEDPVYGTPPPSKMAAYNEADPYETESHNSTIAELDKKALATHAGEAADVATSGDDDPMAAEDPVQDVFNENLMPGDSFTKNQVVEALAQLKDKGVFSNGTSLVLKTMSKSWFDTTHGEAPGVTATWDEIKKKFGDAGLSESEMGDFEKTLIGLKGVSVISVGETPAPEASPSANLDTPGDETFGTAEGISGKLSTGVAFNFADLSPEDAIAQAEALVGNAMLIDKDGYTAVQDDGSVKVSHTSGNTGIYYVESFDPETNRMKFRAADGRSGSLTVTKPDDAPYYWKPPTMKMVPVSNISANDFKMTKPATFKSDGTMLINGVQVGTWQKEEGYWNNTWSYEIFPEHSIFGVSTKGQAYKKNDMKGKISLLTIPVAPPVKAKKKVATTKKIKAAVEAPPTVKIDLNPGGQYSDGTEAKLGDWVKSTKGGGGFIGKITSWPNQEHYPGLVFAVDNEGIQKAVNLKTQKKVDGPDASDPINLPNAYTGITLKDGKTPSVGQVVTAGDPGKGQVKGIITNINPTQGWVYIQTPEGKKVSKTYSVVSVDEEPDHIWDIDSAIAAAAAATPTPPAVKKASTPKKGVPGWPGPDGFVIPKDEAANQAWLDAHPLRKLTKDGYAPKIGMRVRTSKGQEAVITWVAGEWDANPNKVKLYVLEDHKITNGVANTLQVDHAAEGFDFTGNPVQKVKEVELPGYDDTFGVPFGYTIFRYQATVGMYDSGGNYRQKKVSHYVAVSPDENGKALLFQTGWNGTPHVVNTNINQILNSGNVHDTFEKVAVVEADADLKLIVVPHKQGKYSGGEGGTLTAAAFAPSDEDPYVALGKNNYEPTWGGGTTYQAPVAPKAKAEEVPEAAPEIPTPEPEEPSVSAPAPKLIEDSLERLPDVKAPVTAETVDSGEPEPPQITTDNSGLQLDRVSGTFKGRVNSIMAAAKKMIGMKDSTEAGTGSVYATGDADYIEDMAVRYNVVVDGSGNEQLVMRFRLREGVVEDVADKLLKSSIAGVKKGNWKKDTGTKFVTDLQDGDKINVYKSSTTGLLKPKDAGFPNVTVMGVPKQVGESNGFPLYRVTVVSQNGNIGEVDIEKRATPSLVTFTWDPDAVVHTGSSYPKLTLTDKASAVGWTREAGMKVPHSGVHIDESGKASLAPVGTENGGGSRLHRKIDGGQVFLNAIHKSEPHNGHKDGHRPNLDGEVRIQVPLDGKSDADIQAILAKGMESVGVPIEKQGPASTEQISLFALEKFVTQYSPTYVYRDTPITGPSDARVTSTLALMNKELKPWMDREITLNDLRVHTWDTGRIQVVMSPEVARAISSKQHIKHYSHSGAGSVVDRILGGTSTGLMSTDERWSLGIMTSGMSSSADLNYGSGDRVYLHGLNNTNFNSNSVIINPAMVAVSTEVYQNQGDGFGARKKVNDFLTHEYAGHEYMYKRKFEPEQIAYITTYSEGERQGILDSLRKRSIYEVNGRKIEDIIVTASFARKKVEDDYTGFLQIGMDLWKDDIPIDTIMSGPDAAPGTGGIGATP